ncbi:MAG: ATP-binding protein [Vicinamibacterales bacterium]
MGLTPRPFDPAHLEATCADGASVAVATADLLRAVLAHMTDGVLLMSAANEVLLFNPAAGAMLGISSDEPSRAPRQIWDAAGTPLHGSRLPSVRAINGECVDEEILRVRVGAEGPDRWLAVTARPLGSSVPAGAVLVFRDVTAARSAARDRAALELQVRQAQRMEAVGQLAGGVAHDFNNLLQAITGFIDLARADLTREHPATRRLEEAARAAERAASLTRQLLLFSRREPIEPRVFDVCRTAAEMTQMIRRVIGAHIDLELHAAGGPCAVEGDPGQIEQVLLNLCVNARDALVDGGVIRIEVACGDAAPHDRPGRWGRLTVRDTGPGVDPAVLPRIFEPFFTTKPRGQGTGLGLATVWAIAERHGGIVEVQSAAGEGAAFHVWLPLSAAAVPVPPPVTTSVVRGCGERVLLVEDEEQVRALAEEVLRRGGYHPVSARDGEEAVRLVDAAAEPFDAALIDLMLPRRGGRAVASHLSARMPSAAVVLTSGYDGSDELPGSDAAHVLRKPYVPSVLLACLREAIDVVRQAATDSTDGTDGADGTDGTDSTNPPDRELAATVW